MSKPWSFPTAKKQAREVVARFREVYPETAKVYRTAEQEYGSVIAGGAAWVGKPYRGDPGFYWQDATDPEAVHHGPHDTFDKAEEAARTALGIAHDE